MKRETLKSVFLQKKRNSANSFTLIELLVVIAIIAILAGILLPALNKSKQTATQAGCQSNLKQLGMGFLNYVDDFNGHFPPFSFWLRTMKDYSNDAKLKAGNAADGYFITPGGVLTCPGFGPVIADKEGAAQIYKFTKAHYGMNRFGMSTKTEGNHSNNNYVVNQSKVKHPSQMLGFGDCVKRVDAGQACNVGYESIFHYGTATTTAFRHGERANFLFLDGHVERRSKAQVKFGELGSVGAYLPLPWGNK